MNKSDLRKTKELLTMCKEFDLKSIEAFGIKAEFSPRRIEVDTKELDKQSIQDKDLLFYSTPTFEDPREQEKP